MRLRRLAGLAIGAWLLLRATGARAEEGEEGGDAEAGRLPLAYAARPLTLPQLVLDPIARFAVARVDATFVNLAVGAAFGVTDDLEVQAVAVPLQLSPSVTYGQLDQPGPGVGATYRVLDRRTQIGLHVDATAITLPGSSGLVLRPGLPIRSRAGEVVRLDYGVFVRATVARTTAVGFEIPFAVAADVAPPLHFGLRTGLSVETVDAPFAFAIPLGVFAGYAIQGKDGPILDIDPFFLWPRLLTGASQTQSSSSSFQVGVGVRAFFYL